MRRLRPMTDAWQAQTVPLGPETSQAGPWQLVAEGLASMGNERPGLRPQRLCDRTGATICEELSRPSGLEDTSAALYKRSVAGHRLHKPGVLGGSCRAPGAQEMSMEAKCIITQQEVEQPQGRREASDRAVRPFVGAIRKAFRADKVKFH